VQAQVVSIQTALQTASKSLSTIKSSRDLVLVDKRQSESQIAALVAEIVTELATTLGSIANSTLIESLLPGLDADLNAVLSGLETLLAGVLNLVATLCVFIAQFMIPRTDRPWKARRRCGPAPAARAWAHARLSRALSAVWAEVTILNISTCRTTMML
jgi:hypothetical protein